MKLNLSQQINQLRNIDASKRDLATNQLIANGIIKLLQNQQFYGLILSKLNRQFQNNQKQSLGLKWINNKLIITYNPDEIINQFNNGNDLLATLNHLALHIIWLHPLRYNKDDNITRIATDLSVNQYINHLPKDSITLDKMQNNFNIKLPQYADSKVYFQLIFNALKHDKNKQNGLGKDKSNKRFNKLDNHSGWTTKENEKGIQQKGNIKKLVNASWRNTDKKYRGTIPGHVKEQLNKINGHNIINWKQYIKIGIGKIPYQFKDSKARFNRRQPYRMELPGRVSNTIIPVNIFVDNSGSMGNNEISFLINQIGDFLNTFTTKVTIYTFDTNVHYKQKYTVQNKNQLQFLRIGGGGTKFQSVFNYIHHHSNMNNDLNIILTDGQGEKSLNYYLATNILWVLTMPINKFSVLNQRGNIVSLINDPQFIKMLGWRN